MADYFIFAYVCVCVCLSGCVCVCICIVCMYTIPCMYVQDVWYVYLCGVYMCGIKCIIYRELETGRQTDRQPDGRTGQKDIFSISNLVHDIMSHVQCALQYLDHKA